MARPSGSPNIVTKDIRDKFSQLIASSLPELERDLKTLKSSERIRAIIDLSKFVIPTLKATTLEAGVNLQATEEFNIRDVLSFTQTKPQEEIKEPTESPKVIKLSAIELEMQAQERRLEEERKNPQPRNNEPPLYNIR